MADKVTKKRDFSKAILIAKVSVFWVIVASLAVAFVTVDLNAYVRGQNDGNAQAIHDFKSK